MKRFKIVPEIMTFSTLKEYFTFQKIGGGDVVFADGAVCKRLSEYFDNAAYVVDFAELPKGEPTDSMVEYICSLTRGVSYNRVVAIGGGTVLDVAKLFSLIRVSPVVDLFLGKIPAIRDKHLTLIPATCGTGSEMTNISILELTAINSKFGLAADELYADEAVLIPELLSTLPFKPFAASSIDALVHSMESFTSPKANEFTRIYSKKAIEVILEGFKKIAAEGQDARFGYAEKFLTASNFAGIAFGNAGCAAVHAMSYPLGAGYHVAHGEANYAMLTAVYKKYMQLKSDGAIAELNEILAASLGCKTDEVYGKLETLLDLLIKKQPLHSYGMKESEIESFADTVLKTQTRLLANNFVTLERQDLIDIYQSVF